jgi:hypothetical protein
LRILRSIKEPQKRLNLLTHYALYLMLWAFIFLSALFSVCQFGVWSVYI